MHTEYKTNIGGPSTEPLTLKRFLELADAVYRKRPPPPPAGPLIDWQKMAQHGIGFHYEGDLILMSPSELRRARECGAITSEPSASAAPEASPSPASSPEQSSP